MPGDQSQTMDSDAIYPKKLRKILPRPRNAQLVILNQATVKSSNAKEPPNLRSGKKKNNPPPLLTNTVQNESNVSPQNAPKILPLNTSLAPLAVINEQGMKVNVVKAVWVPSSPGQPPEKTNMMASNAQLPSTVKPNYTKVVSLCDDNEFCCRLCGTTFGSKGSLVDVFGAEGKSANLQEKVHRCLPISITESDKLPSTICQECICVLELSFKLLNTALKTDQQLHRKLIQKVNIGGIPKSNLSGVIDTSDKVSRQRGQKAYAGHPSFDHTYISRGSKADVTDKRNETGSKRTPDNGSVDSTECNLCGKVFNDIEAFLKHVESDHIKDSAPVAAKKRKAVQSSTDKPDEDDVLSEISLLNCFKCKEICLDDEDLQFHLNNECVVCDVCGLNNRSRRAYVLHLKKHHEIPFEDIQRGSENIANEDTAQMDENRKSKSDQGNIVSDTIRDDGMGGDHFGGGGVGGNSLDGAAENGSINEEQHTCLVCLKVFRNRVNFGKHEKLHDPLGLERERDPGTYKCDVCPRSYHRKDNLLRHKRMNHSDGKKYPCCFCEARFDNPKDKTLHEKQDHSVAQNEVDGVDPKKPDAVATKPKENRLWICGHCGKALSTKMSLIEHERIHSGSRPFACEICGRTFRTKPSLFQHRVVHTKEKKFPCPICEKVFSRQSFVRQHVRTHTGEKPFACDICGRVFSQSGDLNRHRNRHMEIGETNESLSKKRKLSNDISTDEVKDAVDGELDESLRLSSSSDLADTSDIASDMDAIDTIACEVCSEEFQDLSELREHRFVEHGQEYQEVERAEEIVEEEMVTEEVVDEVVVEENCEEVKEYVLVVPS